jgi:hypothetical protein
MEKYFSANFSPASDFQCEASGWTYSYVQTRAVLPIWIAIFVFVILWHPFVSFPKYHIIFGTNRI